MKNIHKTFIATGIMLVTVCTTYAMSGKFKDFDQIPSWAKFPVMHMEEKGVMSGYENGNFGPNDAVTRAQLAVILERYEYNYLRDYSKVLMNYKYFEKTNLSYEVKTALTLAMAMKSRLAEAPSKANKYNLVAGCSFADGSFQDGGMIKKINSNEIPKGYTVYYCEYDPNYGGGYYVHHEYTGSIPGTGDSGTLDLWYGPFSANILLSS